MVLRSLSRLLLIVTAVVALLSPATATADEKAPPEITAEVLAELLAKAERWQVPSPPANSEICKIKMFERGTKNMYALGYLDPAQPQQAVLGFSVQKLDEYHTAHKVDLAADSKLDLDDVVPASPFQDQGNAGLVTSVQLMRQGEKELGYSLLQKSLMVNTGHPRSAFFSPAGEPAVRMLGRACLASAVAEITSEQPDFANIQKKIETILSDLPELRSETTAGVLRALAANVAFERPAEGTVARVVDDYMREQCAEGAGRWFVVEYRPAESKLIAQGFDAIPILLEERKSIRLTNHKMVGFNNFVSYPMTVSQVADGYLSRFANNNFQSEWLMRQKGEIAATDRVEAWWKEVAAMGERAYVARYTLQMAMEKDEDTGEETEVAWLGGELLILAKVKYPEMLPDFYRRMVKTTGISWRLANAIADADGLSLRTKVDVLKEGLGSEQHRRGALRAIYRIDSKFADEQLTKILRAAPRTPEGETLEAYAWLMHEVSESTSKDVWLAASESIQNASPLLRIEMLGHLSPPREASPETLAAFFKIIARYEDDTAVWTGSPFENPHQYDGVELRNIVHLRLAHWLDLKLKSPLDTNTQQTDEDVTDAAKSLLESDWAEYRATVQKAAAKYWPAKSLD